MDLMEAIIKTKLELLDKYKDVKYKNDEVVIMTKNTTTSNYIKKQANMATTKVKHIENRFEIEGEIEAIKVTFEVKYPEKRKYIDHEEYYEVI
ncbi:hypothetical protein [Tissierella sp.]|uniref:hypothetical protein n=1 Tax=Tissierella sp. TaxID=41274 RepID=UPI003020D30C